MMKFLKTPHFWALFFLVQLIVLKVVPHFTRVIENTYSFYIYPPISLIFRNIFNIFSFSFGDILYTLLAVCLLFWIFLLIKNKRIFKMQSFLQIVAFLSIVLFLFNLLWGFNYYRAPLVEQLKLDKNTFTQQELENFSWYLINDINATHLAITNNDTLKVNVPFNRDSIYLLSEDAYYKLANKFKFLKASKLKVKSSLYSTPLSYMGFAGYLNPFTNEAQVNSKIPLVSLITTSCHEIGHQVGFGAEYEANMLAYLVSTNYSNMHFKFAGKFMALRYTLNELYITNPTLYEQYFSKINPGIIKNMEESYLFWEQYQNPLEPVFKNFYDLFLKSNAQKEGIKSYKRVVGLLINYHLNKQKVLKK